MKTTLNKAVKIYEAIKELEDMPLGFSTAHALVLTKAELEPHVAFFIEKETALIEKYAVKDADGNPEADEKGRFHLHPNDLKAFNEERDSLNSVEVEIKVRKIKELPASIKPATLEALLPVFNFPEEDENAGD